jgi:hypothetical protein
MCYGTEPADEMACAPTMARQTWSLVFAALICCGCASSLPPAPAQPLAFSHKLHAGDHQIPCEYCHAGARRSAVAGVPSLRRCFGCHLIIAADRPEIQRLTKLVERKQSVAWVKVTDVPDFVRFSHRPHVQAGVDCRECHGAVTSMELVQRASTLEMGWCVDCHRRRRASTDCLVCHH